ncbi:MAG: Gfo/Idh/MocA family oxidoreductase [Victivallaceae bacterium]|nr:Gfo/Idh/MocA family oxidoreductase [Victivallaceae bacterium]
MKKVKFGIIGLGFFGEKHAEVLSAMTGVELSAVCTRRADRLKEMAARFGIPKTFTDYRDLLADPEIDAVSIVTHVNDHRAIAVEALQAGKHVLLEKPMAGTVDDCRAIIAAAKKAAGVFMVGHICRFDARVYLAKKAVAEGKIGRIISMHARRNLPKNISAGVLDKISPLMGDGIHDIDLMLWLTGCKVNSVYAKNVRVRNFRYPDLGWAMCSFANGAVGVIETVWHLPENTPYSIDAQLEIIGTEGVIYIDCGNAGLTINDAGGIHKPDTRYWPEVWSRRAGALADELTYFIDCVSAEKQPQAITPEESMAAVMVMCAAEKSAAENEVITL